jgi:hypothetical protein
MQEILKDFSAKKIVKSAIKTNWENYHYCLGKALTVELSIGRHLTWLITAMPDHFMNLVVCTDLPSDTAGELIANALAHFKSRNIEKLSWLAKEGEQAMELRKQLIAHGLIFRESFAIEMAADLTKLPEINPIPNGLSIIHVEDHSTLREWIHVASIGFGVPSRIEAVWCDFFEEAIFEPPFRTYLALLNGKPVATSQLFISAGVAGIYNVTCLPEARGKGIGAAITVAPLLDARTMGYKIGILQASAMGYPVYQRLGFEDFGKLSVYLWNQDKMA